VDGKLTDPLMTIAAAKLDSFFPQGSHLDLVKIHVEGAAGSVFEGIARLLREVRPILLIEFHRQAEWEATTVLFELGYALWDLSGRKLEPTTDTERLYHCLAMPSERSPKARESQNPNTVQFYDPLYRGRFESNLSRFKVGETLSKPSCLFVNTYYTRFLDQYYERHNTLARGSYALQKDSIQRQLFGDCDFYSQGLRKAGWVAEDVIANCVPMQQSWAPGKWIAGLIGSEPGLPAGTDQAKATKRRVLPRLESREQRCSRGDQALHQTHRWANCFTRSAGG
jgi:hypothetical protein